MKILTALLLTASFITSLPALSAPEKYTVDPSHTYVLWHINHFKFSHPSGKWFAHGTLTLDQENHSNDKIDIVINIAEVSTGLPKLDAHLKAADFFDVAKFPQATYVSSKVTLKNAHEASVLGNLTIRGITKPVTLAVKLNNIGISPISNNYTAGFSAQARIKRSDFGLVQYLPGLGDDIDLDIQVEASKVK